MEYTGGDLATDEEHDVVTWMPISEAISLTRVPLPEMEYESGIIQMAWGLIMGQVE